jgi:hypothetical protein
MRRLLALVAAGVLTLSFSTPVGAWTCTRPAQSGQSEFVLDQPAGSGVYFSEIWGNLRMRDPYIYPSGTTPQSWVTLEIFSGYHEAGFGYAALPNDTGAYLFAWVNDGSGNTTYSASWYYPGALDGTRREFRIRGGILGRWEFWYAGTRIGYTGPQAWNSGVGAELHLDTFDLRSMMFGTPATHFIATNLSYTSQYGTANWTSTDAHQVWGEIYDSGYSYQIQSTITYGGAEVWDTSCS